MSKSVSVLACVCCKNINFSSLPNKLLDCFSIYTIYTAVKRKTVP